MVGLLSLLGCDVAAGVVGPTSRLFFALPRVLMRLPSIFDVMWDSLLEALLFTSARHSNGDAAKAPLGGLQELRGIADVLACWLAGVDCQRLSGALEGYFRGCRLGAAAMPRASANIIVWLSYGCWS
ncbi:hypothetical protein U1Q18_008050 [Sarracenia purpurea var. burkii]